MNLIDRYEYPFINQIMWDTKKQELTYEDAFDLCERRWKYFENNKLTNEEQNLLDKLIEIVGKGFFMHV